MDNQINLMGSTRKEKETSTPFSFHLEEIINEDLVVDQFICGLDKKKKRKKEK